MSSDEYPGLAAAAAAHEHALADSRAHQAVVAAEHAATSARLAELQAAAAAAARRVPPARGRLTRARRDGAAQAITTAAAALAEREREHAQALAAVTAYAGGVTAQRLAGVGETLNHYHRTAAAGDAVLDALHIRRPGGRA